MSDVSSLLEELAGDAVQLWVEGGTLKYRAPAGALTPQRLHAIRTAKQELTQVLLQRLAARLHPPEVTGAEAVWLPTSGQRHVARLPVPVHMHDIAYLAREVIPSQVSDAVNKIVERHSVLRTVYAQNQSGELWAATEHTRRIEVECIDLTHLTGSQQETQARMLALARVREPFDLVRGPQLRITLLKGARDVWMRIVVVHHSIFDRVSSLIFFRELAMLSDPPSHRHRNELHAMPVQFRDHARRQNVWLDSTEAHSLLVQWRHKLESVRRPFWLPVDRHSPFDDNTVTPLTTGMNRRVNALRELAKDRKSTLFVIALTVFAVLLSRWSGESDVLIWNFHAGRDEPELKDAIGLYADCMLLKAHLDSALMFHDAVDEVHRAYVEALASRGLPPLLLRPLLRGSGRAVSPSATFNFLPFAHPATGAPPVTREEPRLDWVPMPGRFPAASPFGLMFVMIERAEAIEWTLQHQSALFEDETIGAFSRRYNAALETIVTHPAAPIAEL